MKLSILFIFVLAAALLGACKTTPTPQPAATATQTAEATAVPASETPVASVRIAYEGNAQVEIISPQGVRILIDVANPAALSSEPTSSDILLTTHKHGDHYYASFVKSFPGGMLDKAGEITAGDVKILGIAAAHNAQDPLTPDSSTNYIFILEIDRLRIVHFGDIGQEAFTNEQLKALGRVDLAITQFVNSYSAMSLENKKGFNLMDEVQPKLIIPTHTSDEALKYGLQEKQWIGYFAGAKFAEITPEKLPSTTGLIIIGDDALSASYQKILDLKDW